MSQFCSQSHFVVAHSDAASHLIQAMRQQQTVCIGVLTKEWAILTPCSINLVAELMEQFFAELVRLATELDTVRDKVQTDLLTRATTAAATAATISQQNRRLNDREVERHFLRQFGVSRVDHGEFAFRIGEYAAVLSHDAAH